MAITKHGYKPIPPDKLSWISDLDTSCRRDFCVGIANTALASLQALTQGVHTSLPCVTNGCIAQQRATSVKLRTHVFIMHYALQCRYSEGIALKTFCTGCWAAP